MKKLSYSIEIDATPDAVYRAMLGLDLKATYERWTAAFNPTSTYQGNWEVGGKMYFIGTDEQGKRGGMIAKIEENKPGEFVSILHYGMLDGENEILDGPKLEAWSGAHENYRFEPAGDGTRLHIEIDTVEEYIGYFDSTWPKALEALKEFCEG